MQESCHRLGENKRGMVYVWLGVLGREWDRVIMCVVSRCICVVVGASGCPCVSVLTYYVFRQFRPSPFVGIFP